MSNHETIRERIEGIKSKIYQANEVPNFIEKDKLINAIKDKLDEVNREQADIRAQKGNIFPEFVAHATHVSQDEYKENAPNVYEGFSSDVEIVPAFPKETQNELNAVKDIFSSLKSEEAKQLKENLPTPPKRVFAITTKVDESGKSVLDENGVPVPQDGSYAYSLKKCAASINFVDDNIPLLIGSMDKYDKFATGESKGHIYIGKGDSFKAEYDSNGNITEYTSLEDMKVIHHLKTTPKEAMEHNVQFVMFNSQKDYDNWIEKLEGKKFETFILSSDDRITSLQEEIRHGKAVFINATSSGANPKIECLSKAQEQATPQHSRCDTVANMPMLSMKNCQGR